MGLRDFFGVVAGVLFLAGLTMLGAGLALFTCNLIFHSGFYSILVLSVAVALVVSGRGLGILTAERSASAAPLAAKIRGVCQYCGKATANRIKCDNCGGNPGLGGEGV